VDLLALVDRVVGCRRLGLDFRSSRPRLGLLVRLVVLEVQLDKDDMVVV